MKYCFLLLWLPVLLSAEVVWQANIQKPFAITIKLNTQQVPLGGFFDLEVDFQYPSSYKLKNEALIDQLTWSANPLAPQVSLYQSSFSSIPAENGMQAQHLHATLKPLVVGHFDLSLFTITFEPKENSNSPFHVLTPVFNLQALPPPTQMTSLSTAPLMPLEPEFPLGLTEANRQFLRDNPERWEKEKEHIQRILKEHTFPWITLVALLGCGGIGWAAYLTRERWFKHPLRTVPIPSPKQQINQDLKTLQAKHLFEEGFVQKYYTELASILLNALQTRLGWKTKEMTTFELAQALKNEPTLSSAQKKDILLFLTEMDQVKFADKKPTPESAKQLFQQVQIFIQQLNLS